MLKSETIEQIATLLSISPSDLKEKISSEEEQDIAIPELEVFKKSDFQTRLQNEKATSYQEGKVAQEEMLVKQAKKDLGYDFEGKSFDSFMSHHSDMLKEKYSKNSDSRVQELEADIKKLNETHSSQLSEVIQEKESLSSQFLRMKVKNNLLSVMPAETTIDKADIVDLFNMRHQIEDVDGKLVVKKDGEVLKDENTASPLEVKDVFGRFLTEKKYIKGEGGRNSGNDAGSAGSGPKTVTEFNDRWRKSGKNFSTPEYNAAYAEFRKKNTDATQ